MADGNGSKVSGYLDHQMLIAMPGMGDPRFEKSVVFMCAHSEDGALGLIINKPTREIRFQTLLEQLDLDVGPAQRDIRVHFGGPVEQQRGFVLHSADYGCAEGTLKIDQQFRMTATMQALEDIGQGHGPKSALFALGYAGWGPGQLESELSHNAWLTVDASPNLIFQVPAGQKWAASLESLGIDPMSLSAVAGRA